MRMLQLAVLVCVATGTCSLADDALIKLDTAANADPKARDLGGGITASNFKAAEGFPSVGDMNGTNRNVGTLLKNFSKTDVEDIEVSVTSKGDKIDRNSGGGALFKSVKFFDAAGKDVTNNPKADAVTVKFSDGTIKAGGTQFWMLVPKTSDDKLGGHFKFTGMATPQFQLPPAPMIQPAPKMQPKIGNDSNPMMSFSKPDNTLNFNPGTINFVQYKDGSVLRMNTSFESVIGSQVTIDPMKVTGPSSIPGAFQLQDSFIDVAFGSSIFHIATLTNDVLIPDSSVPGFDSVLESTLVWNTSVPNLPSQYLSQLEDMLQNGDPKGDLETELFFRTNLLDASVTNDLTMSGKSTAGSFEITPAFAIPEPRSVILAGIGCLAVLGGYWSRMQSKLGTSRRAGA